MSTSLHSLGHPDAINDVAALKSGIVFIAGPMNSGKTTTLAALGQEYTRQSRRVAQLSAIGDTEDLGVLKWRMPERPYKLPLHKGGREKLNAARRFSLLVAGELLDTRAEVVLLDDLRTPEAARIATLLAGAGLLVVASIHHTGKADETIQRFNETSSELGDAVAAGSLIDAVIHQKLTKGEPRGLISEITWYNQKA